MRLVALNGWKILSSLTLSNMCLNMTSDSRDENSKLFLMAVSSLAKAPRDDGDKEKLWQFMRSGAFEFLMNCRRTSAHEKSISSAWATLVGSVREIKEENISWIRTERVSSVRENFTPESNFSRNYFSKIEELQLNLQTSSQIDDPSSNCYWILLCSDESKP